MGAFAHLAGFHADGGTLLHTHPLGPEITDASARGGPSLRFHVMPEKSGPMQFYLQVKRSGQELYLPFGRQVQRAPGKAPAPVFAPRHAMAH
jgi:hypothetical protein